MDAVMILGSLLSTNAMGSKTGGRILDSHLGGGSASGGTASGSDMPGALLGGGTPSAPPREAQYFGMRANGLGMAGATCNRIHRQLGQPGIFA